MSFQEKKNYLQPCDILCDCIWIDMYIYAALTTSNNIYLFIVPAEIVYNIHCTDQERGRAEICPPGL